MEPLPLVQHLGPLAPLALEPARGLQVVHTLSQLPGLHPGDEILLAFRLVLPEKAHLVEALTRLRDAKLGEGCCQVLRGEVSRSLRKELQFLLLCCELHGPLLLSLSLIILLLLCLCYLLLSLFLLLLSLRLILILSLISILFLLGLFHLFGGLGTPLSRRFRLLPLLLDSLLARSLRPLPLCLQHCLFLLLLEERFAHPGQVFRRGFAYSDHRGLLEIGKVRQSHLPIVREEVSLNLHNHVVALQGWRDGRDNAVNARVIQEWNAKECLGLVFAGLLRGWRPRHATLDCPLYNRSIAELHIAPILSQEVINTVKCALVRNADRQDHLAFFPEHCLLHHAVSGSGLSQQAALEGKSSKGLWTEAHLEGDILVGDGRIELLAPQSLWERHWI
mmetsp:Transcript_64833/g.141262  ORF Transcript_64833/g.141262 Transcript_64833/m.141262 type:complete len:391 (-) Transcript_64833:226-1398(-)